MANDANDSENESRKETCEACGNWHDEDVSCDAASPSSSDENELQSDEEMDFESEAEQDLQESGAKQDAAKQPVMIGAYTAQLCSFCGQKHRGGRAVCQGKEDDETPVLPERQRMKEAKKHSHQPTFQRSSARARHSKPRISSGNEPPDNDFQPTVFTGKEAGTPVERPEDLVGETLSNKYALLALIGKGGMSAVYSAKDLKLNKTVAVKVLLPHLMGSELSIQRFQIEAQAAAALYHPNLIVTHDFGVTLDGRPYLVMELLEGISLADLVKKSKRLKIERAVPIFIQICDALAHAHGKGVFHRDLKPSNVMVSTMDSGIDMVRLLDFGIAKMLPKEGAESLGLTRTGEIFGSPNYMSPEQCSGARVDARSDLYSMGCLMYEVLSGTPPLVGDNIMQTLLKQANDPPPDFKTIDPELSIPQQLQVIVFKALAKLPEDRYQTAEELGLALRAFQQNVTVILLKHIQNQWQVFKFKSRPLKKRERKMLLISAVLTVLLLMVSGKLLSMYWHADMSAALPADKVFMPAPPTVSDASIPHEVLVLRKLIADEAALKKDPNSQDYLDYVHSLDELATTYSKAGQLTDAEKYYRKLLALSEKNDGPATIVTRGYMERLADCLFRQSQYKEAASVYEELYERINTTTTDSNDSLLSTIRVKQSTALYAMAKYSDAIPGLLKSVKIQEESGRAESQMEDYAITCARLAECYRMRKLYAEAAAYYKKASTRYEQLASKGSQNEARNALVNYYYGYCLYKQEKFDKAVKVYRSVVPKLKKLTGLPRELTIEAMLQYSEILWKQGQYLDSFNTRIRAKELQKFVDD